MSDKQYTASDVSAGLASMVFSVATFTLLFGLAMLFGLADTKQDHKRPF